MPRKKKNKWSAEFYFLQKQAKDYLGVDGDEESAMYEDSVSPAKYVLFLGFNSWASFWLYFEFL